MFWSFAQPTTVIDDLFNQEDLQLETLLEEDDLLQECKAHNSNLIRYFSNPEIIKKLLNYITNPPEELDELKKLKYSYLSCEILSCDIWPILDAIMENTDALVDFWKFVDRDEPLEIFQASYFCKVNLVLLQYKLPEMLQFIRGHPDILSKILKHISSSPIAEILLKLISISDREEANGIIEWLQQEKVIPNLVSRFDPFLDDETHTNIANTLIDINSVSYTSPLLTNDLLTANIDGVNSFLSSSITNFGGNALVDELKSKEIVEQLVKYMLDEKAPNSTSSLIHGTTVIIDLIRRYCGDIEQAEYQQHQYDHFQQENIRDENQYQDVVPPNPPTTAQFEKLSLALNDLLNVLGNNLEKFEYLLLHPKSINGPIPTTLGEVVPLGTERLRVCELFAEVIHLQYLYSSSPLFDRIVFEQKEEEKKRTLVEELITITDKFTERKMLPICLNLFFEFPWNNFLHSVVYDMIAKIFNTCSYLVTATNLTNEVDDENQLSAEEQMFSSLSEETKERMNMIKNSVIKLTDSILDEGQLPQKIVKAQKLNDEEEKKEKGLRLGYMGHLTHISDEICKLMSKCSNQFSDKINDYINGKDWNDYINNSLQETKNRDCQALGGQRPNNDTITNISFGYQPQDFEYDSQEDQYRLNIGATDFGDEEDDMNEFDVNGFESMISSNNSNRDSHERFFENSSEDEMDSSEEEDWINGLDNQDKLDSNLLGQSEWTADFSDFDNHINGGSLDDQDKLNDWANFDEAFSPDKINAVNISTSSNDSRDENTSGLDKENILGDLDNNNIVDTLNNLTLDEKESKDTNNEGDSK
ncbi:SAPS-domain-containing protein [Piromyces finnis]|uniref:SAPS-domain-containing protein n=1 Tax=Piromyces finnis TaxID=1754191 RepID=A0A1Y1VD87_9FUNG|nr:SAPS-domain-containing protein [Piromyces finnis]|eukprot:ORX53291.1 SAPS-domain-containing protein [Piromyces finnis]